MRLHNLIADKKGSHKSRKRVGRGRGSGHGKTSTRGHKGQKARSGGGIPIGFEGGQLPLYRILPTRGFNNAQFRTDYAVVNVGDLARFGGEGPVDRAALVKAGLVRKADRRVKVLARGEIDRALEVRADKFSAAAVAKIEAAGGKAITVTPAGAAGPGGEAGAGD